MPRAKRETHRAEEEEQDSQESAPDSMETRKRNMLAAMSYVLFLFVVPMFIGKKDAFLKFHMRQGFALFVVGTFASFFVYIPILGWILPGVLMFVAIYAGSRAFEGKTWRIPYISSFADRVEL